MMRRKGRLMRWFAVRCVYLFGRKSDGTNIFEERIVAFNADSFDEALDKAKVESLAYAKANAMTVHPVRDHRSRMATR